MENVFELRREELMQIDGGGPLTIMNGGEVPMWSFLKGLAEGFYDAVDDMY